MRQPLYLSLDQGGQSTRAMVFDEAGVALARASVPVTHRSPLPGTLEQDPEEVAASVARAIETALRVLASTAGSSAALNIVSAGLATQRASLVCWDSRTGLALSPILSWQDRRAVALVSAYKSQAFTIRERTGLVLSPHYGALKMRWCLDNIPAVRAAEKAGHLIMGPVASFLAFRSVVPQPLVADPANAGRTLLWSRHRRDWDPELLEIFGISEQTLPNCTPSRYPFGGLRAGGAHVPLAIMTGDQGAALFSEGVPRQDTIYINMGTGAFLQRPVGNTDVDLGQLLWSVALQDGHESVNVLEGTVNGAGEALAWGSAELPYRDLARHCEQLLGNTEARPLFLNTVGGLGSPYWRPDIAPRFEGEGSIAAKAAAIIESVIFLICENIDAIQTQTGLCVGLVVTGGMAECDGVCQALANVSGLNVRRPGEHEGTSRGLAFLAAGAPAGWPKSAQDHAFWPMEDAALRDRFQRWRQLMPSVRGGED
ncbi:MAG: FGGY family carbohydrate kinase [Acidiferrobacter sp.]